MISKKVKSSLSSRKDNNSSPATLLSGKVVCWQRNSLQCNFKKIIIIGVMVDQHAIVKSRDRLAKYEEGKSQPPLEILWKI